MDYNLKNQFYFINKTSIEKYILLLNYIIKIVRDIII